MRDLIVLHPSYPASTAITDDHIVTVRNIKWYLTDLTLTLDTKKCACAQAHVTKIVLKQPPIL